MNQRPVRDHRGKNWWWSNNEIIDDYGPKIGSDALATYFVLCRMANDDTQTCFPSVPTIARLIKRTPPTVRKALGVLEDFELIHILERPKNNKENESNLYTLLPLPEKTPPKGGLPPTKGDLGGSQNGLPHPPKGDLGEQDLLSNKTNEQGNRKRLKPQMAKAARMAYAGLDPADQIYISKVAADEERDVEDIMWQFRDSECAVAMRAVR